MVLTLVAAHLQAQQSRSAAAVSGIVRNAEGTPQMGAMVQLVAAHANPSAFAALGTAVSAFTDIHGRYLIRNVPPGRYQLRATAALFMPALHDNLQLHAGAQAVVNVTLNTLFEAAQWLPVQRRQADEPDDDWKWTLRAAANRPILRWSEDDGSLVLASSSKTAENKPSTQAHVALTSGDGGFGEGGLHTIFTIDRVTDDGAGVILRAKLTSPSADYPIAPSTALSAGYERQLSYNSTFRGVMTYQMNPELVGVAAQPGIGSMTTEVAERTQLTDAIGVEVGSELSALRMANSNAVSARPFARIIVHPTDTLLLTWRVATARDLQGMGDMDAVQPELPVAVMQNGRLQMEHGFHQEISVGHKAGGGTVQVSWYDDHIVNTMLSGVGTLSAVDISAGGVVVDPITGTFRALGPDYKADGFSLSATQPLGGAMWVLAEFDDGSSLAGTNQQTVNVSPAIADLHQVRAQSAIMAMHGTLVHTGTHLRASYRWQPESTVSAVNPYHAFSDQAYLSFYVRQPLHFGHVIPNGVEAIVDVTNLLAQGYRPFLSSDGRTIYFAQAERRLQAGLSFSF